MANIKSINGNPIVLDASGLADNSIPDSKLVQNGGALNKAVALRHDATIDGWINGSGQITSRTTYARTDYIPFIGDYVFCDEIYNGVSSYTVAFYDEQKNFISAVGNSTYGSLLVDNIPDGAVYLIASGKKTGTDDVPLTPCVYCFEYQLDAINRLKGLEASMSDVKNLHGSLQRSGYYSTIGAWNSTSNAKNTDFMVLTGYARIRAATLIGATGCAIAFFDEGKAFMSSESIAGTGSGFGIYDVEIPVGATYAVVSYYDASGVYANFEAVAYNEDNLESRVSSIPSIGSPQLLIFGDSITDNMDITVDVENIETTEYSARAYDNAYYDAGGNRIQYNMWPRLIKSKINFTEVRNYAKSGASYRTRERTSGYERQNLDFQVQLAVNDANDPNAVFGRVLDPDIVIFALGTNDGAPNDTPSSAYEKRVFESDGTTDIDSTLAALDRTKFCEAAMWAFLTVKRKWPFALGFVVLPIQRADGDTNGGDLHDYLEDIAGKFGYVVIDGYTDSGIIRELNVWNDLGVHLKDGLHPNEKGQNMMARMIVSAINSHYVSFDGMNS